MDKKIVVAVAGERNTGADIATCITRMYRMRKIGARMIVVPSVFLKKRKLRRRDDAVFHSLSLGRYDWLIFTSKNSVEFFIREMHTQHIPLSLPAKTRIAAVGQATAAALRCAGVRVDLVPAEFSAKDIVQALDRVNCINSRPTGGLKGKRILFPRSAIAPFEPVRALRDRGARVTVIHLYTTISARIPRRRMEPIEKGKANYLVFMSPSSIAGFMKNAQGHGKGNGNADGKGADARKVLQTIRNIPAVCIGPLTATAARRFGFTKIHTAKTHSAEGISDLLGTLA